MFTQIWNKYIPIIRILLKKSASEEQTLNMNRTDFERAAGGRKVKYSFTLLLNRGRVSNVIGQTVLVKELTQVLLEDDSIRPLLRKNDFELTMNTSFQLMIKNCTPPEVLPGPEIVENNIAETPVDPGQ
jgi:hypothetical protein